MRTPALAAIASLLLATSAGAATVPLQRRLLRAGEFPGFAPTSYVKSYASARSWVAGSGESASKQSADVRRLTGEGFRAVALERLAHDSVSFAGLSWVMRFASNGGACAEGKAFAARPPGGQRRFTVVGVPDSWGFHGSSGDMIGGNVVFCHGDYLYLLGYGLPKSEWSGRFPPALGGSGRRLYDRVRAYSPS